MPRLRGGRPPSWGDAPAAATGCGHYVVTPGSLSPEAVEPGELVLRRVGPRGRLALGHGEDESIRSLSISGDGVAYTFVVSTEAWPSIVDTTSIGTPSL